MSRAGVPIADLLIHAEFVRALARDLTRDVHRGDDLAQDAWVQALRRPPLHGVSLRGWLALLVGSLFANHARAERRRAAREAATSPPQPADAAADIAAREQTRRQVLDAVLALDEPFRTAVLLRYHDGLTPAAIARQLGVPAATVRTRVARGLERLRQRLDREHGDDRAAWALPLLALPAPPSHAALSLPLILAMKKLPLAVAAVLLALAAFAIAVFVELDPPTAPPAGNAADAAVIASGGSAAVPVPAIGERAAAPEQPRAGAAADAPGEAEPAEARGDLRIVVTWADGTPAAGVHVFVGAATRGARELPLATATTGADGRGEVQVRAGAVRVGCDRGGQPRDLEVLAGQTSEVALRLDAGVDVAGTVRDVARAPVAGATIWLTAQGAPWRAMAPVAVSDAAGAFVVRAAPPTQSLGATAAGRAPTALVDLESRDTTQSPARVELEFGAPGAALVGRVVDERGDPVAGATVAVGSAERLSGIDAGGRMVERWAPAQSRTDASGTYRFDSLAPATHPVEVWAPAFPLWHGEVAVAAGAVAQLDVMLPRGVTVHGCVRGPDGAPLPGAIVRAFPTSVPEMVLAGGQYGYESTFGYPFALADGEGRYLLRRAKPGPLHLFAAGSIGETWEQVLPWATTTTTAAPGATIEWNVQIVDGPTIRGVVRHRDGAPMGGTFVLLAVPGKGDLRAVVTDRDGRFRFVCLQQRAYDVSVQLLSAPEGTPTLQQHDVWPGPGEVELVAAFDAPERLAVGSVRGSVLDAAGRAPDPASLRVLLVLGDRSWRTGETLVDGRFMFDRVAPGRMRAVVLAGEDPILVGEEFELQPAEAKDLGALTTVPGASLIVHVVREPGTEGAEPSLSLRPLGALHGRKVPLGRAIRLTVDNLSPGELRATVRHDGLAVVDTQCRVVAGATAELTVELRAAVPRELQIRFEPGQRILHMQVADEGGATLFDYRPEGGLDRPFRQALRLPLGRFRCRVETAGGGVAEHEFAMTSLDPGQSPIVVVAR
jgi:RNA polymerase sigma-70 factor (ECF subfamily)